MNKSALFVALALLGMCVGDAQYTPPSGGGAVVTTPTGTAPSTPASGFVSCYFDSTSLQQICIDANGNTSTMVRTGAPESITTTCTGANTFAAGSLFNGSKTLTTTGSCSLGVTGMVARGTYNLIVTQGSGGSHTLALTTGGTGGCTAWLVSGGGGGTVTPSVSAGAVDMLVWYYDGTNCYATYTKTFN